MSILSFVSSVGVAGFHPHLFWQDDLAELSTDLSVPGLRAAYASGLYPCCESGPQTWRAPAERMVLFIENFHIEPAVRRRLRRREFHITFDQDFAAVVHACTASRTDRMSPGHRRGIRGGTSRRDRPLRGDLGSLRRSCRRHFRSRHRQGLLHRRPLRQGERCLQGRLHRAQLPFAALGLLAQRRQASERPSMPAWLYADPAGDLQWASGHGLHKNRAGGALDRRSKPQPRGWNPRATSALH